VEVSKLGFKALKSEGAILNESMVYCINRKNTIIEKITKCIEEYKEINIKGFITFRMKEFREDLESIIDKVVENYMVEKEYNEFIKLLKYFVEIQESKIDEVNIIFKENGDYLIQDNNGEDILSKLTSELSEGKYTGNVCVEDMLISGLITNCPKKIIIHRCDNCGNSELLETIKNVFLDRVIICSKCKICKCIKNTIKV
jgi:putative sporulation protein YtxC